MKKIILLSLIIFSFTANAQNYVMVIHGGAGNITKENMTSEKELHYKNELMKALQKGYDIINSGGSSLNAVEAAVNILEDSPLFNAGKGAVFNNKGENELDASIMDGKTLNAGAVAGVKHIKNPISLARKVMEKSSHVMMVGEGAEEFAQQNGFELVDNKYFYTDDRWNDIQNIRKKKDSILQNGNVSINKSVSKFGTVGAVALDMNGNLAAATSTGGMTNKKYGRVGDTPIIGAGTYAKNKSCAVSATGHGEFFIRLNVAHTISDLMEFANLPLKDAADSVIYGKLTELGGTGGVIAIDSNGNIAMPFNTPGMFRGYILYNGEVKIEIFK